MSNKKLFTITIILLLLVSVSLGLSASLFVGGDIKPTVEGLAITQFAGSHCIGTSEKPVTEKFDMSKGEELSGAMKTELFCNVNTPSCKVQIDINEPITSYFVYYCPIDSDVDTISEADRICKKSISNVAGVSGNTHVITSSYFNYNSEFWTSHEKAIIFAKDVPFGGYVDKGDITVNLIANAYTLKSVSGQGLVTLAKNTCALSEMHKSGNYIFDQDYIDGANTGTIKGGVLGFDNVINYISGLTPITDSADVIKRNDEWVYVKRVGEVCPIEHTPSEFSDIKYFVDCSIPIKATEIVCLPSSPGCKEDGTEFVSTLDEMSCTWYGGGLPEGWYPKTSGSSEYCLWTCVDGKPIPHSCQTATNCIEGQVYDYDKQSCIGISDPTIAPTLPNGEKDDNTLFIIAIFVLIAGIVIFGGLSLKK